MIMLLRSYLEDETGVTLMEYALVASIVSLAGFPVWTFMGETLDTWYGDLNGKLETINNS